MYSFKDQKPIDLRLPNMDNKEVMPMGSFGNLPAYNFFGHPHNPLFPEGMPPGVPFYHQSIDPLTYVLQRLKIVQLPKQASLPKLLHPARTQSRQDALLQLADLQPPEELHGSAGAARPQAHAQATSAKGEEALQAGFLSCRHRLQYSPAEGNLTLT